MAHILLVIGLALAAGVTVYLLSLRLLPEQPGGGGSAPGSGFGPEGSSIGGASSARDLPQGYGYVPLAPGSRSWETRVLGLVGLILMVALAAAIFAVAVYQVGHVVNHLFAHYVNASPTPTPSP